MTQEQWEDLWGMTEAERDEYYRLHACPVCDYLYCECEDQDEPEEEETDHSSD